ncbi:Mitogen-activated protein kinase kinase kinase 3 [Striga hermonthica]|uniref:mitogen-activated protein kinase kinase kinase n=1 Tax=Striga hermonthica TaxID=68872 RepID=A0A9N7NQA0_STRHE|nr:Mitogen-activated protein kinase kinase kinase 3 [Striga hermonthica]
MQDFVGSARRRSLVPKTSREEPAGLGAIAEKIGSSIRRSRIGLFAKAPVHASPSSATPRRNVVEEAPRAEEEPLPPMEEAAVEQEPGAAAAGADFAGKDSRGERALAPSAIRWRKGELIGCGAFGRVYMGMNLDSGELLAVKEVAVATNSTSKKTQGYIDELEKEVNLLKNLSHPNIVRYLGTAREEDSLNILLEFVPGGSISSLLGKFGSFPESVIRMYTKQLLIGLEYLHANKIMHRDIKGANILVDNKACIKLADFGASKRVEALVTVTGAKSMKGTPYWMAPEVIVQSGHSYSADIWSVGCTVIEMATGKAPWSQQYQEVAALFYIGTTKSHPPIPEHLSSEAKDFLLKCLQKEPDLRSTASELLKHPFVTGECQESNINLRRSIVVSRCFSFVLKCFCSCFRMNIEAKRSCIVLKDVGQYGGIRSSIVHPEQLSGRSSTWKPTDSDDDMCRIDDDDDLAFGAASEKVSPNMVVSDCYESYNPICKPNDDWPCKFDGSSEMDKSEMRSFPNQSMDLGQLGAEDDDEVTESKIRDFLDEKAFELKKLQTPLYQFYNSSNVAGPSSSGDGDKENAPDNCNLPCNSKSPSRVVSKRLSVVVGADLSMSPRRCSKRVSITSTMNIEASQDMKELLLDSLQEPATVRFSEIQRKWKEELDEELERTRELMRQAGAAKTSSPKDQSLNRLRDRSKFASPRK